MQPSLAESKAEFAGLIPRLRPLESALVFPATLGISGPVFFPICHFRFGPFYDIDLVTRFGKPVAFLLSGLPSA